MRHQLPTADKRLIQATRVLEEALEIVEVCGFHLRLSEEAVLFIEFLRPQEEFDGDWLPLKVEDFEFEPVVGTAAEIVIGVEVVEEKVAQNPVEKF